jgi:hypothetical protein
MSKSSDSKSFEWLGNKIKEIQNEDDRRDYFEDLLEKNVIEDRVTQCKLPPGGDIPDPEPDKSA